MISLLRPYWMEQQYHCIPYLIRDSNISSLLQSYSLNITTVKGFETFLASLKARSSDERSTGVDLVLSCVNNYEARMVVNQVICPRTTKLFCPSVTCLIITLCAQLCIVVQFIGGNLLICSLYLLFRHAMSSVRRGWSLVSWKSHLLTAKLFRNCIP